MQRVLEVARKHNLSIIVTDIAGREAMVLMSLSAYDALMDGSTNKSVEHGAARAVSMSASAVASPVFTDGSRPRADRSKEAEAERQRVIESSLHTVSEAIIEPKPSIQSQSTNVNQGYITREEQFFLTTQG